ncbi:MAG: hypothetical protein WC472_03650 [Candidatus Paceibacterota bacterium]
MIKKNLTLILAISIPIAMILLIAISIYLPSLFMNPQYEFLYSMSRHFIYSNDNYVIENEKLLLNIESSKDGTYGIPDMKFYIYNTINNTSKEISYEEAQKLRLDPNIKSIDGFEIVDGNHESGFFPFYYSSRDYDSHYLKNSITSKKLNLKVTSNYDNFNFIGWIKK